jgi:hypothetical protein
MLNNQFAYDNRLHVFFTLILSTNLRICLLYLYPCNLPFHFHFPPEYRHVLAQ